MKRKNISHTLAMNVRQLLATHRTITSQEKLSAKSGLGQSSISRIIRAETAATIESVSEIARAFGVSIPELLMSPDERAGSQVKRLNGSELMTNSSWPFPISLEEYLELQKTDKLIIDRCMRGIFEFHRREKISKTTKQLQQQTK